ncbi:LacI family DNA-binding transcriptional regulator [Kitasatospora sp. NPDC088134]|uniref:LacI family DNA-binding transcriptional regulator n=1 Tax=Kitasatospora sp. NPDC088134 TaxID=3364071 RepID=UPI0037F6C2C4
MSDTPPAGGPAPRIRLVDVAREAGLSKTTVSAALNGTGRMSEDVRRRAREAARRLGYRPNATARLLRAGHARLIGYAVGEFAADPGTYLGSPYFARLTSATAAAALERGYALVLLPAGCGPEEWADLPLDAAIVADPIDHDPLVEDFLAARVPLFTDRSVEGRPGAHWVDVDAEAAVREVLDHLHGQGARRVALLSPGTATRFHRAVTDTYLHWCAEHGLTPRQAYTDGPGDGPVLAAVDALLTGPGDPPDALFVLAEAGPPLVLDAVRRAGLAVPEQLLLVCASEEPSAEHTRPPVSTLSMSPAAVAVKGIELLIAALESGSREPTGALVPTRLEIRASSLRPPD